MNFDPPSPTLIFPQHTKPNYPFPDVNVLKGTEGIRIRIQKSGWNEDLLTLFLGNQGV